MPISAFLRQRIGGHLVRSETWAKPAGIWVALFTVAPDETGGGLEAAGGGYSRVKHGPGDAFWSVPVNGVCGNVGMVRFGAPTTPWGIVRAFALFGAATGGEFYGYGLIPPLDIGPAGGAPYFLPGALRVRISVLA